MQISSFYMCEQEHVRESSHSGSLVPGEGPGYEANIVVGLTGI